MKSTKSKKLTYGRVETGLTKEDFLSKNVKFRVNMFVDLDIVEHFRDEAKRTGDKYQTLMNKTLREAVFGKDKEDVKQRLLKLEKAVFKAS